MARAEIAARRRTETGKGPAKRLRGQGWVPAILYGHGRSGEKLSLEARQIGRALDSGAHVVAIQVAGEAESSNEVTRRRPIGGVVPSQSPSGSSVEVTRRGEEAFVTNAVIREVQVQPVSQEILHVDLQAVAEDEMIDIMVPISLRGEPAGVKEGGVLDVILHEVGIRCPASAVFDSLRVDVSGLEIGGALHVGEIALPEGAEAVTPAGQAVVIVRKPREVVEEDVAAAGTEVAEQPEVIGEKAREEGETGEGGNEVTLRRPGGGGVP